MIIPPRPQRFPARRNKNAASTYVYVDRASTFVRVGEVGTAYANSVAANNLYITIRLLCAKSRAMSFGYALNALSLARLIYGCTKLKHSTKRCKKYFHKCSIKKPFSSIESFCSSKHFCSSKYFSKHFIKHAFFTICSVTRPSVLRISATRAARRAMQNFIALFSIKHRDPDRAFFLKTV